MKTIFLSLLLTFIFSSCTRSSECDPNKYCNTDDPDSAWVNVFVSYETGETGVPLVLYRGYVEDNEEILRDTLYYPSASYYLPTREFYSVKVTYEKDSQVINAYDGEKLRVNKSWNCDERCYDAPDINLNAELID